jgi:hypothetical protein
MAAIVHKLIKGVKRMADLSHNPRNTHNPYVATQPVRRVDHAGGGAAGGDQEPSATIHIFFMEAKNLDLNALETWMRDQTNMDVVMFQRNDRKFWFDGTYITRIKITGTIGGGSTLQLQITTCK